MSYQGNTLFETNMGAKDPFANEKATHAAHGDIREGLSGVSKYNDLWAAVLFYIHLAAVFALSIYGLMKVDFSGGDNPATSPHAAELVKAFFINIGLTIVTLTVFCACYMSAVISFPRAMVTGSFVVITAGNVALGLYLLVKGGIAPGLIVLAMAAISMIFMYLWRHRIAFSALLLETTAGITRRYPALFLSAAGGFFAMNLYFIMVLFAAGGAAALTQSNFIPLLLLFCLFWTEEVISTVNHVIVAGVFATYYFVDDGVSSAPNPTAASTKRALTTSFGSVCFGALFVAAISFTRALLDSARRDRDSFLGACASCLLRMIEDLVKYFNHYAFVQVAIYGKPYIAAAKDTWALVKRSGIDLLVNDNILGFVFGLSVITCGLLCGGVALIYSTLAYSFKWTDNELALLVAPSLIIGFVSMSIIVNTLNSGVSTIFVCFCEDPEALRRTKPELYDRFESRLQSRNRV